MIFHRKKPGDGERWFLHWGDGLLLGVGCFSSPGGSGVRIVAGSTRETFRLPAGRIRFQERPFRVKAGNCLFSPVGATILLPAPSGEIRARLTYCPLQGAPGVFLTSGRAFIRGEELDLTGSVCQFWEDKWPGALFDFTVLC